MGESDQNSAFGAGRGGRRLPGLDILRGSVMVLMALDHVRGFWAPMEDLAQASPPWLFTRWITHFCAPVFVFLAGTGAYLFQVRGRSRGEAAWFLLSRGVWLIFLEFTLLLLSWNFSVRTGLPEHAHVLLDGRVIWAIGCSMVVLSGLVYLPG